MVVKDDSIMLVLSIVEKVFVKKAVVFIFLAKALARWV